MADLHPSLQTALLRWRYELAAQRDAGEPVAEDDPLLDRSLAVIVATELSESTLAQLGLTGARRAAPAIMAGEIRLADLERLVEADGVTRVSRDWKMRDDLDKSVPHARVPPVWNGSPGFRGANVIIGIIDTGVDFFHDTFRKADRSRTRILKFWNQRDPANTGPGNVGAVFTSAQIEAAYAGAATPPRNDGTSGHGTHVASIAAGDGSAADRCTRAFTYVGVAPAADLIVVARREDRSFAIEALNFIFDTVEEMIRTTGTPRPVVINMSFGYHLGPHDGTDTVSQQINRLLNEADGTTPRPGRVVVKSAGNEGVGRRHARKPVASTPATQASATFRFEIAPTGRGRRDETTDNLQIWFDGGASLEVTVQGPSGSGSAQVFAAGGDALSIDGTVVSVSQAQTMGNGQKLIDVEISASAAQPAPEGLWQIQCRLTAGASATIDIWVDRIEGDANPRFIPADAVRENTINIPGMCRSVITVASYDSDTASGDFGLAASSSWGLPLSEMPAASPPLAAGRLKPDIAAPGIGIMAAKSGTSPTGAACSTCCDELHVHKNGTSMAAPHVTGAAALILEKNRTLNYQQVRAHLQLGASRTRIPAAQAPPVLPLADGGGSIGTPGSPTFLEIHQNHLWGAGRLDVEKAVANVPALASGGGGGGAGAGGGGGGGSPRARMPEPIEIGPWPGWWLDPEWIGRRPAFQLFAALVSTHVDEVRRLIDTNKRVAVVWRRGGGPAILRHRLGQPPEASPILPARVDGFSLAALIDRLLRLLDRFGSTALRADIGRWGDFVLAAVGADIDAIDARLQGMQR